MAERFILLRVSNFVAPALEFSTLLEITEAGTIYSYGSYTSPTTCSPVALGFKS